MIQIINKTLIFIFAVLNIYISIRILYLAKKDNYKNRDFLEKNKNMFTKIMDIINIICIIYFIFIADEEYENLAIKIYFVTFCFRDFYIQYKYADDKKRGQLIPYGIVIIFFTILGIVDYMEVK
ncbi:hypothetical protein [Tepidibacter hydrothermalis]|uniref:DUF4181 domain-containing protein n=1 Tax=Tepidibacter hydrothermalis TaxID=3036126 RepID=A0ABY8ECY0_9FIRM|nr:hypothetical protein [Tepidibacter hydrothermalis]WFD10791.1 hypothetical protein P4S50_01560 [Tepidibacter hydrothermalis]